METFGIHDIHWQEFQLNIVSRNLSPGVRVGGLHLLYTSYDFLDPCRSPLGYLLSSLRNPGWLNCSLPDSHCLIFIITVGNDATFPVPLILSLGLGLLPTILAHHYIFLFSFLLLSKVLVIFACFCFYHCEAVRWCFYRTIYYNSEIPLLSGNS